MDLGIFDWGWDLEGIQGFFFFLCWSLNKLRNKLREVNFEDFILSSNIWFCWCDNFGFK